MNYTDKELAEENIIKLLEVLKANYFKLSYRNEINRLFIELNIRLGERLMKPVIDAVKELLDNDVTELRIAFFSAVDDIIINQTK